MQIDLCNKLVDNNLTRNELLERVEIRKTSNDDLEQICKTLAKSFNLSSFMEAFFQLKNSKARLDESIKLIDKEINFLILIIIFLNSSYRIIHCYFIKISHAYLYFHQIIPLLNLINASFLV